MKTLFVGLWSRHEPQEGMRKALMDASHSYHEICWIPYRDSVETLEKKILFHAAVCDTVFLQLQAGGVVSPQFARQLREGGRRVFNFTGDVRMPIPQWYFDLAPHVHTLFSDGYSVDEFAKRGLTATHFPMAVDETLYSSKGGKAVVPPVVFMGNHYAGAFPETPTRLAMVRALKKHFGKRFMVFGSGYPRELEAHNLMYKQRAEASVYRGAKIAISHSHFALSRYTSDRLVRIMSCGCMALSHAYPQIEKDFATGTELGAYNGIADLVEQVAWWLANDEKRKTVAQCGHRRVMEDHTWAVRFGRDLKRLYELEPA